MKIEFERLSNDCISCTFCGGSQMVVVEEKYTPEKYCDRLDFFGKLATRALEQAFELERREAVDKVVKNFVKESKNEFLSASAVAKLYDESYSRYQTMGLWPKKNPFIVGGSKAKVERMQPRIEKVIFNCPATIVFWSDGDKTVVKANKELFDREKGLAMAIAKKFLGNKGNYFETFKKYIK